MLARHFRENPTTLNFWKRNSAFCIFYCFCVGRSEEFFYFVLRKPMENNAAVSWYSLPVEVAGIILSFVTAENLTAGIPLHFVCKQWHTFLPSPPSTELRDFAVSLIEHGPISLLQWARQNGCPFSSFECCVAAAKGGNLKELKLLMKEVRGEGKGGYFDEETCRKVCFNAALGGHLEVLKWLRKKRSWCYNAFLGAAQSGNLELLKWLWANGMGRSEEVTCYAARGGHLEALQWLYAKGFLWEKEEIVINAAASGNLEMMEWLRDIDIRPPPEAAHQPAENGNLEMLKWLKIYSWGGWSPYTMSFAVSGGHLEVMNWLHENGCPVGDVSCIKSLQDGNLEVLKWLREHGCSWGENGLRKAAENGHFEVFPPSLLTPPPNATTFSNKIK